MAFAVSRSIAWVFHINMRDASQHIMHLPDPLTFDAVWRMPGQPPGFGLLVLLLSGWRLPAGLLINTALGLALVLSIHFLARDRGVPPRVALWGSILFSIAPATLLFERMFHYTYIIVGCIGVGTAFLAMRRWAIAFWILAVPCWMHAFFHPAYLAATGLAVTSTARRPRIVLSLLLPLAFAAVPTVKNGLLYDFWAASSWAPYSLGNMMKPGLAFHHTPFPRGTTGHEVTDQSVRPDGDPNFMNINVITEGRALLAEEIGTLWRQPSIYWRGLQGAIYFFLQGTSRSLWSKNRDRMHGYETIWNALTTGALDNDTVPSFTRYRAQSDMPKTLLGWRRFGSFPWLSFVFLPLLYAWGLFRAQHSPANAAMSVIVLYATCLAVGLELGENMRFKAYIGPLLAVWLCDLAGWAWSRSTLLRNFGPSLAPLSALPGAMLQASWLRGQPRTHHEQQPRGDRGARNDP